MAGQQMIKTEPVGMVRASLCWLVSLTTIITVEQCFGINDRFVHFNTD